MVAKPPAGCSLRSKNTKLQVLAETKAKNGAGEDWRDKSERGADTPFAEGDPGAARSSRRVHHVRFTCSRNDGSYPGLHLFVVPGTRRKIAGPATPLVILPEAGPVDLVGARPL